MILAIFILIGFLFFKLEKINILYADGAVQNLDEVMNRKLRLASVNWGYSFLENPTTHVWQPETLNYADSITNNEVWKITNTPTGKNETQDISTTHWSADGKRLMFHSLRPSGAWWILNAGTNLGWMQSNADGSFLRVPIGSSALTPTWDLYPAWSPILADVFYSSMSNDGQSGTLDNTIYKMNVTDQDITRQVWLTLPGSGQRLTMRKGISGDGRKVMIKDTNSNPNKFYPATVYPDLSKGLDSVNGYPVQLPYDWYWGRQPADGWNAYHDQFMAGSVNGVDGIWYYVMPENTGGSWWRSRIIGSGTDGQPIHNQDQVAPYDWGGELEPVNTGAPYPFVNDPWNIVGYVSHFTPDRWARYGIFTKSNNNPLNTSDTAQYETSLIDLRNHNYWNSQGAFYEGSPTVLFVQHHDWEAWSDWSASDGGPNSGNYIGFKILTQNFKDPNSQKTLTFPYVRYNGSTTTTYEANPRPTQSPDGTKILFSSTYLNNVDDQTQLFWTVAYYPYPPEIKSAAKIGSNVRLTWDFNQGSSCSNNSQTPTDRSGAIPNLTNPRTYATRGWPHETLDCAPSPREIDKFRVWSSDDNIVWVPEGTTTYNNCRGDNECGMWTENSWNYDANQNNNTVKYYAITSQENSGLESRSLSNVWKVITDSSGNIIEQTEQSIYPASPGGKQNFYTTKPDAPTDISQTHDSAMQYTINWKAPINKNLVKYYNIYARDGAVPNSVQQMRIASIAATTDYGNTGNFSYIDWAGNSDGSTQYVVTSVDYQGNESSNAAVPTSFSISNFVSLVASWLSKIVTASDLNSDNIVNAKDLGIMMSKWN